MTTIKVVLSFFIFLFPFRRRACERDQCEETSFTREGNYDRNLREIMLSFRTEVEFTGNTLHGEARHVTQETNVPQI